MTMIHLGWKRSSPYEAGSGDPISVPVTHTLLTGITRHGKSEAMKTMAKRVADEGYTVLLFDVKAKRDYGDIGQEIPIYLEESTDPMTLKGLLESSSDISLSFQFSEIIEVCEGGEDYEEVLEATEALMADDDTHPVTENKLRVIRYLLDRMIESMGEVEISDDLELGPGVNVMDLHDVDEAVKQVAIAASVEEVKDNHERVIVGIDEAHNFIPQKGKPPANEPITDLIREAGASDSWVWLSDQTITGVDKDPLKQVDLWLLGRQREKNEAGHVLDQIPGRSAYSTEDVMMLKKGHFIVTLEDRVPLVYVQPTWMSDAEAQGIAREEYRLEDITESDQTDMTAIEDQLEEAEQRIAELENKLEDREERIEKLNALLEARESKELKEAEPAAAEPEPHKVPNEERVAELVRGVVEDYIQEYDVPEAIEVDRRRSKIVVRHLVEPITVSTDDRLGKVAYLYAEGELPDGWFGTGTVEDIFETKGWGETTVRRTDVLNTLTQAGFLEMKVRSDRSRRYRIIMEPEEAREKGLLEVEKPRV